MKLSILEKLVMLALVAFGGAVYVGFLYLLPLLQQKVGGW